MTDKNIIKNGRITEKATTMLEKNIYTFDIAPSANKTEIKKAIFAIYKIKPVRVNVLGVPKKNITFKGRPNTKGGGRKAVVYLKKGDKIEVI